MLTKRSLLSVPWNSIAAAPMSILKSLECSIYCDRNLSVCWHSIWLRWLRRNQRKKHKKPRDGFTNGQTTSRDTKRGGLYFKMDCSLTTGKHWYSISYIDEILWSLPFCDFLLSEMKIWMDPLSVRSFYWKYSFERSISISSNLEGFSWPLNIP